MYIYSIYTLDKDAKDFISAHDCYIDVDMRIALTCCITQCQQRPLCTCFTPLSYNRVMGVIRVIGVNGVRDIAAIDCIYGWLIKIDFAFD